VRRPALLTGRIDALGKIRCTMIPRIFPEARKFPVNPALVLGASMVRAWRDWQDVRD